MNNDGIGAVFAVSLLIGLLLGLILSSTLWKREAIAEGHARYHEQTGYFEWRETGCLGPVCLRQPQPKAEKEDTE